MAADGRNTGENRLEIDVLYGLRALMVLMVANFHIWQQSWLSQTVTVLGAQMNLDGVTRSGYLFVDGMLLLSGFLLFLPHARAMTEGARVPSVRRFYINRLIRIVPSYAFAVLAALFCFALPEGSYASAGAMWLDLGSHLTFTHTFFENPYLHTPLNGVLWTVAVEMQFYLIFPLLAGQARARPARTLGLMALAGWLYRLWVYGSGGDTAMLINQMPAFLDVYALGMLGAMMYIRARAWLAAAQGAKRKLFRLAATLGFLGGAAAIDALLLAQSAASGAGFEALRLSQLRLRLPFALALLWAMLSAAFLPGALRWLFGNRLMRFFAEISFNFYIWHQILAVRFARLWFPQTLHFDPGLQRAFTLLCYLAALTMAAAVTYGLEKPAARAIRAFLAKREAGAESAERRPA